MCVAETSSRSENSSEDQDQDEDFYCVKDWTLLPRDKIKIMSRETWSPSSPNLTKFFMAHIFKYEKNLKYPNDVWWLIYRTTKATIFITGLVFITFDVESQ